MADSSSSGFGLGNSQDMMYWMALSQMGGGQGGGGTGLGFDPMMFMDPRKRMGLQMAQSMMQQGMSTAPALTPLAGLSRLGSAIMGRNMMSDLFPQQQQGQQPATPGQLSPSDAALKAYLSPADWNVYSNLPNDIEKLNWRLKTLPAIQEARAAPQHLAPNEKIVYGPDGPRIVSDLPITDIAKMASDRDAALKRGDTRTWAALNTQIAEAAANKGWPVSQDAQGNVQYQAPIGPASPAYAGAVAGAEAWAKLAPEVRKLMVTPQMINGVYTTPAAQLGYSNDIIAATSPQTGAYAPPAGGGAQGATGPQGPAGSAGTAAGGDAGTGAPPPPAATGSAPAATGTAPASTTPTPPTQTPPPTSAEKNVTNQMLYRTGGTATGGAPATGGANGEALAAGVRGAERTPSGKVGAAGEVTPYQITAGAAQAVGMALPTTDAEGKAVAQAYMTQNLRRFGNLPDAFAAYNWGPNATANWINRGRDPSKMPQAVKDYVQRAMGAYNNAAGGAPPAATATAPAAAQQAAGGPSSNFIPEEAGRVPGASVAAAAANAIPTAGPAAQAAALDQGFAPSGGTTPLPVTNAPITTTPPATTTAPAVTATKPVTKPAVTTTKPTEEAEAAPDATKSPYRRYDPNNPLQYVDPRAYTFGADSPFTKGSILTQGPYGAQAVPKPTDNAQKLLDAANKDYAENESLYNAAQNGKFNIAGIRNDIAILDGPDADKFWNTDQYSEARKDLVKTWNAGMDVLDPNGLHPGSRIGMEQIAAIEDWKKNQNRLGMQLAQGIGQGTDKVVGLTNESVPNPDQSGMGAKLLTSEIDALAKRAAFKHDFQMHFATAPGNPQGVLFGSGEEFEKQYPPEHWAKLAVYNTEDPDFIHGLVDATKANGGKIPPNWNRAFTKRFGSGSAAFALAQFQQGFLPGQD